ncbi:MAG: DUF3794 domain-containing protein [Clostridia bacterium]|nr:DUF3794 domain-containing protein [Clostridia bacterium]
MDISLENTEYCSLKRTYEATVEESVEAEISLPEYMPEILRIVKSQAIPKINSFTTVGERVTVDGTCELRMIYVGSDNCIYSFSQTRNFTRYCENSAFLTAEDVKVKTTLNYVNCRATNTKRAEIKAGVGIFVCAFGKIVENILLTGNSKGIEEKQMQISAMSLGCKKSRMFAMSDTFNLENDTAAFLIRANAVSVLGETRKISNKVMLKGETIVEIAYVPNEDKSVIRTARRILPINQILEFDGMDERFTGDITLDVTAVDVIIKNDSQGEGRSLDVAVSINAGITMWEQKDLFLITDAYAINGAIDLTYKKMKFYSALDAIRDTYIYKDSIDVSKTGVDCILDAFCEESEPSLSFGDGVIAVCGSLKVTMLLKDTSGSIITTEKMLDYRYERKAECTNQQTDCVPGVSVSSFECILRNKDQIDVKAEMQINCSVFGETEIDVVTDITEGVMEEKTNNSAITVYFPKHEEALWNIAKRYNTTVESIALENNLEGDTTGDIKMLFIPSA